MMRSNALTLFSSLIITVCLIALGHHYRQDIAAYLFAAPTLATNTPASQQRASYGMETVLMAERDGHFYLDTTVDRSHIRFMVDTGASITVLKPEDARELNIDTARMPVTHKVSTGGGEVEMGSTTLPYIESGQIRIYGVDALVTKIDMPYSVLGMNFLRRLNSYRVEGNQMVLTP